MLARSSSTPAVQIHLSYTEFASHLSLFSLNPYPFSRVGRKTLRKAQSDSNLASTPINPESFLKPCKSMLRTEPSFSIYNSEDGFEEDKLVSAITIGDQAEAITIGGGGGGDFCFGEKGMGLIEENDDEEEVVEDLSNGTKDMEIEKIVQPPSPRMYLATGFGIDGNSVGGDDFSHSKLVESEDVEEYYERLVGEHPSNPLFLSNYAQFLQSKGDLSGAEDFCFRATLAAPKDAEILLQYAKLVWELHRDQDRALSYFECAARAAPEDSNVLAAYASFLWEIEEETDEDLAHNDHIQSEKEGELVELQKSAFEEEKIPVSPRLHLAAGLGIGVSGFGAIGGVDYSAPFVGEGGKVEEYYKKMVEENPCNPLFLRNYAQFLFQTKGDLEGAEEYYTRAILVDPGDGDTLSQYAKLVWELHHDRDKALSYFERAVQATPADSHVLAAYAGFLWETEENEEEDSGHQDGVGVPVFQGQALTCMDV